MKVVTGHLRENPCLLIWDNVEKVEGYPVGTDPQATHEEQEELSHFLKQLRGGKTKVLITSRKSEEKWLGVGYHLMELIGLSVIDRGMLAKSILDTAGRSSEDFRNDPEYSRLLDLLRGHPRSMEVVLPHLRDKTPGQIIDGLQHHIDELGDVLDASLNYVFPYLSERTRTYLPFVGVFTSYVHENVLGLFSEGEYFSKMGERPHKTEWKAVLEEAASAGLVRSLGSGWYELHPTFPLFLRKEFGSRFGEEKLKELDLAFMKFYGGWSAFVYKELKKRTRNAVAAVRIEEANLLRALHLAEMNGEWVVTQAIVQVLCEFYDGCGRFGECNRLCRHILEVIGYEVPEADRDMADLWMFALSVEADYALRRNELETAESARKRIIDYLKGTGDPSLDRQIAVGYHSLGTVSLERQQFDTAEEWYKKALEIRERLGLEWEAATTYHQLGIISQERQQFDAAEEWYKKALEIFERLRLEREAATTYHQLGRISQERQQFAAAEEWYKKALEIFERLKHPPLLVNTLAQFGVLYREQERPNESVASLGKGLQIATNYHMGIGYRILVSLGKNLEIMGEEKFVEAWSQAFKEDPPLDAIREIRKRIKKDNP